VITRALLVIVLAMLSLCSSGGQVSAGRSQSGAGIDPTALPIGDGRVSSYPQAGYVWACATAFGGGGAFRDGPWIEPGGSFDLTAKPAVAGDVAWPSEFAASIDGPARDISGDGLPDHATGVFPIQQTDPAYQYDRNPNPIVAQRVAFQLPATPAPAAQASCLPQGPIGIMLTGSYIFNALDAGGRDALAHEIQDHCDGHAAPGGLYHYHSLTPCIDDPGEGHSALIGYALDGFGIFGPRGEDGQPLTNADLDACHGHTHLIEWDGQMQVMYHYHATLEYPYTLGCFRGSPVALGPPGPSGAAPGGHP
jgi:hypothetical protein